MGLIKSCFSFLTGTVFGVYVAQNYDVPNMQKLVNGGLFMARVIEQSYRKPKNPDDDSA